MITLHDHYAAAIISGMCAAQTKFSSYDGRVLQTRAHAMADIMVATRPDAKPHPHAEKVMWALESLEVTRDQLRAAANLSREAMGADYLRIDQIMEKADNRLALIHDQLRATL